MRVMICSASCGEGSAAGRTRCCAVVGGTELGRLLEDSDWVDSSDESRTECEVVESALDEVLTVGDGADGMGSPSPAVAMLLVGSDCVWSWDGDCPSPQGELKLYCRKVGFDRGGVSAGQCVMSE